MMIRNLAALLLAVTASCNVPDLSSEYSVAAVRLPDGHQLYFKREVRGITGNYDVISISANGDPCRSYDADADYCICTGHDRVYYRLEGDTLHLYGAGADHAPAHFPFQLQVVNHDVHPLDREAFERDYAQQGIVLQRLDIDPNLKCP